MICPDVSPLENGEFAYSDSAVPRSEGSFVNYSCDTGYGLTGEKRQTCTSSGWDGIEPRCEGVHIISC